MEFTKNNKFTIENPMPPLWMMYPHISQFSIGWRMGYGEGYKYDLFEWLGALKESEKQKYKEMFPAPKAWGDYYHEDLRNFEDFTCEHVELWNKHGEMQYSLKKLIDQYQKDKKLDYVFFWKPENEVVNKSCLGQWQLSKFEVDVDEYCCAEQYMMSEKARLFQDNEIIDKIMSSSDPKVIKALGKKVKGFDQILWDKAKYSVVLNANYFKFSQNIEMRNFLLSTRNKILVEASPLDTIWGIGLSETNGKIMDPTKWRGQNLLGFALMEVRDDLKRVYQNYDKINWQELSGYSI